MGTKPKSTPAAPGLKPLRRLARLIWGDWQSNAAWQRIVKNILAFGVAMTLAVVPPVVDAYGPNTYLIPMATVFAYPGQRMGVMLESVVMILVGSAIGMAWSLLGLYLSSLYIDTSEGIASMFRALFLLVLVFAHGYIRSSTPRLFVVVWFLLVASTGALIGKATEVTVPLVTGFFYPLLTGVAVLLVVNVVIFPEFTTSYLGSTTIGTVTEAMDILSSASHWFMTPGGDSAEAKEHAKSKSKGGAAKEKTWLTDFLDGFPSPFKASAAKGGKTPPSLATLASLAESKSKLRAKLLQCTNAQNEVNFEFSISPLPPTILKPISKHCMSSLVQNIVTLVGACENKYVILKQAEVDHRVEEEEEEEEEQDLTLSKVSARNVPEDGAMRVLEEVVEEDEDFIKRIDDVKPVREMKAGSAEFLEYLLSRLRAPVSAFEDSAKEASLLIISCLAYCFDVPRLPGGAPTPKGIELAEIDIRIDSFTEALAQFDREASEELRRAAKDDEGETHDLMPRMEMFLVSSFLLGFRQTAIHLLAMLQHSRRLVEERRRRNDRFTLWVPRVADFRTWLRTGGEFEDGAVMPEAARKDVRTGKAAGEGSHPGFEHVESSSSDDPPKNGADEEKAFANGSNKQPKSTQPPTQKKKKSKSKTASENKSWFDRVRGKAADGLEFIQHSEDVMYATKLAIAVFAVSWPSFVTSWRAWYGDVRGSWAPMQLILVFEVSIGTSLFIFFLRLFGVVYGCVLGFAAYEIARGNRAGMVLVVVVGSVPAIYVQQCTKYVKAGAMALNSMSVVALAAMNRSGTAYENFYKRLVAFLVGSVVAILVEVFILPVRARDRLVESLSASVRQIQNMQAAIAVGTDGPGRTNFRSSEVNRRFARARDKAQRALSAAETFLPFCSSEPRLKGSFKPLEPVYREIVYVLHQVIDRMDNVVDLRRAYGSSILEDLNPYVYAYRRNVAASNMLILFSVNEALTTWLPLPQFIPSSRLAQLRLVNRVRELVALQSSGRLEIGRRRRRRGRLHPRLDELIMDGGGGGGDSGGEDAESTTASVVTDHRFLSWNANAAGHMEIIEYLEELVELTKLLVGVNAFRSGVLERPDYKQYIEQTRRNSSAAPAADKKNTKKQRPPSAAVQPDTGDAEAHFRRAAGVASATNKWRQMAARRKGNAAGETTEGEGVEEEDGGLGQIRSAPTRNGVSGGGGGGGRTGDLAVADADVDVDEDVPLSLQRVGSRLGRGGTVRRRKRGRVVAGGADGLERAVSTS
ncbi:hypothetical protein N3K66_002066 [Trichothecium roseum]|uniref:Uncharacterized protein n=1 Tax=Trichothecium roseum TaxID=47278 RepID=A0ACC0V920_9HYPO|nr:hypothetical protein N3K66_002066 [Trichothecium roseum]